MPTYRIALLPRAHGPFAGGLTVESPSLPKFMGGAVIVTLPVDIDEGPVKPPAFQAWPLDMLAGVVVDLVEGEAPEPDWHHGCAGCWRTTWHTS